MKIQVMSDLHLEHDDNFMIKIDPNADLLVLAGDTGSQVFQADFVKNCAAQIKTIMIMGNHEPFGSTIKKTVQAWKDLAIPNLIILDNETVEIDGVLFIGTTLWSDLNADPLNHFAIQQFSSDYKLIYKDGKDELVDIPYLQHKFEENVEFLKNALFLKHNKKVLITHHAPTFLSVDERYINYHTVFNAGFASELSNLLLYSDGLKLCIHGHMHNSKDYQLSDEIRIVCNPRGYGNENNNFDPVKVISI